MLLTAACQLLIIFWRQVYHGRRVVINNRQLCQPMKGENYEMRSMRGEYDQRDFLP